MKFARLAKHFHRPIIALILLGMFSTSTLAQPGHTHQTPGQTQALTQSQSTLLKTIRDNTERFKDVKVAEGEHYSLMFGCVSGPDYGAMGLHYVNMEFVGSGVIDPTRPQIVIYEPMPDGHLQLIGADFLVIASQWDAAHPGEPPQLMGQAFHYFESPNRFGLPAFYTLHVWAWKKNPNGAFVNWHPDVSCQSFGGQ